MSYGKFDMSNSFVYGWLPLPFPLDDAFKSLSRSQKTQKCIDAFRALLGGNPAAIDQFNRHNGYLVVVNEIVDSGYDGAGRILLDPGAWFPTFIAHEMGHAFGLDHSFDTNPVTWDPSSDSRAGAYGDSLDIMSAQTFGGLSTTFNTAFGGTGPGVNAANREKLGWLPQKKVWTYNHSPGGTPNMFIEVSALDNSHVVGHLFLKITSEGTHNGFQFTPLTYLVEFHPNTGADTGISSDAIAFHLVRPGDVPRIVWRSTTTQVWTVNDRFIDLRRQIAIDIVGIASDKSTATVHIQGPNVNLPIISVRNTLTHKLDLSKGLRSILSALPLSGGSVRALLLENPPQCGP
jgi:hypothetical protein